MQCVIYLFTDTGIGSSSLTSSQSVSPFLFLLLSPFSTHSSALYLMQSQQQSHNSLCPKLILNRSLGDASASFPLIIAPSYTSSPSSFSPSLPRSTPHCLPCRPVDIRLSAPKIIFDQCKRIAKCCCCCRA